MYADVKVKNNMDRVMGHLKSKKPQE